MRFLTLTLALAASAAPLAAQRAMAPSPGTPKSFRLAASRSFALPNGLEVTLVPFGTIPNATTVAAAGVPAPSASPVQLPPGFAPKPQPFGVGFTGPACSEPKLLQLAYAFEQATRKRQPPPGLR
jgi:Asp-tRNA(Asn)/Glu-tRNA(Gln) amidotransferase A subunit family amidase